MAIKQRRASKQSGNTFLGIILGLIVGLVIAVLVAFYINRAPTPLASHGLTTTAPNTSASQIPAQPFDPNRSLAGASAVQPTTNQSGLLTDPKIVEVPISGEISASHTPQQSGTTVQTTPMASITDTTATPATKPVATTDTTTRYILQAGAYKTQADAEQQRARLALQGVQTKVSRSDSGAVTYYRVRSEPFKTLEELNRHRQTLTEAGIETAIIRISPKQ